MTRTGHDGTKSSGIPIIRTFTHSFIYSFYKNYLPGSDLGTSEIKQGAKQGGLGVFPSPQVSLRQGSLTPYAGLRAPKGTEEAARLS